MSEEKPIVLSSSDMAVVRFLLDNEHIFPNNTISVSDISKQLTIEDDGESKKLSIPSIYRIIKKLYGIGYVRMGAMKGNSKMYYVSLEGAEAYASMVKYDDADKALLTKAYNKIINPDRKPDWATLYDELKDRYSQNTNE